MAAPRTVLTYPLTGASKDFNIPFEYLARKFVVITLIGKTRRVLVLNSDYRFATRKVISTTLSWGPAEGFDLIEIRRVTSATERLVDFSDGSILRAYDLNTSQVQSLHIAEEARDLTADTIGVNNSGDLDARGRKIVNVADATNPGDAVNLRMQTEWAATALNYATAAGASASASAASATASQAASADSLFSRNQSLSYSNDALFYRNQSLSYSNDALFSRNQSLSYSNDSSASASAAATSAGAGAASASAALSHRDWAKSWASAAEDTSVSGGFFSSLHYSRKSKADAERAQGYAAGVNMPSATGNALKVLRQNAGATGLEYILPLAATRAEWRGTVSQSAGVNTGALFESGTWGNGSLTKRADGTFEGFQTIDWAPQASGTDRAYTVGITGGIIANIIGVYHATCTPLVAIDTGAQSDCGQLVANGIYITHTGTGVTFNSYSYKYAITATVRCQIHVVGRWY